MLLTELFFITAVAFQAFIYQYLAPQLLDIGLHSGDIFGIGSHFSFGALLAPYATGILDSGTTLMAGPADGVSAFYAAIPGSQEIDTENGIWGIPCDTQVAVSVSWGGQTWSIDPSL